MFSIIAEKPNWVAFISISRCIGEEGDILSIGSIKYGVLEFSQNPGNGVDVGIIRRPSIYSLISAIGRVIGRFPAISRVKSMSDKNDSSAKSIYLRNLVFPYFFQKIIHQALAVLKSLENMGVYNVLYFQHNLCVFDLAKRRDVRRYLFSKRM